MPDIFISYAHIDDQLYANERKGWVTHFFNNLRNEVTSKIGRAEFCDLWKDFRLSGNTAITPEIEQQLASTHTLVILLSAGWLASPWCRYELEFISKRFSARDKRIFVVELDQIASDKKPPILRDLLTYRFWRKNDQERVRRLGFPIPQISDQAYFDELCDLSSDLVKLLLTLNPPAPTPLATAIPDATQLPKTTASPAAATVYVAPVNDALYEQRASLISNLAQLGIAALPLNNDWDETTFAADMAHCSRFVQLLDAGWSYGIPVKQHALAVATGKPIEQWRDTQLDFAAARPEQKSLLLGTTVMAASLTEFTRDVKEKVFPKPPDTLPLRDSNDKLVFVHACPDDITPAREVAAELSAKGYDALLPSYQGSPADINRKIERNYKSCDVLLVLHRQASVELVEDSLLEARRFIKQREHKPPVLICQGEQAGELGIVLAGSLTLPCREKFETRCLDLFLQEVGA